MRWTKRGLIFAPDGSMWWAKQYAFPPTPYPIDDETIRIYVACCDENMVGRVGFVDVACSDPSRVVRVSPAPVLEPGPPGAFDDHGVVPMSVVAVGGDIYLYYVGFQLGVTVRYFQFIGLAVSTDSGRTFERVSNVPVLERSHEEFANRTAGFVLRDGGVFKLWYTGGDAWTLVNGKALPVYNLRYVESPDGVTWPSAGEVVLDFRDEDEHAIGRPWVLRDVDAYRMFFSSRTRSKGYRLGYAVSSDGRSWTRFDDEVGVDVSEDGWDSEMVAYPSVAASGGATYLFYNGNNCGETGFGYAELAGELPSALQGGVTTDLRAGESGSPRDRPRGAPAGDS